MRYVNAYAVGKSAGFDLKPVNCADCPGPDGPVAAATGVPEIG
jgi:hypothetical protein